MDDKGAVDHSITVWRPATWYQSGPRLGYPAGLGALHDLFPLESTDRRAQGKEEAPSRVIIERFGDKLHHRMPPELGHEGQDVNGVARKSVNAVDQNGIGFSGGHRAA